MAGDPGVISGMIGVAIQASVKQIINHIKIAIRCKKELDCLKHLLTRIDTVNTEMQQHRKALNSDKILNSHHPSPSTVNTWLNKLSELVGEASELAQHCTVPSSYHVISRYQTSKRITRLVSIITQHLDSTPIIAFAHQLKHDLASRQGLQEIQERVDFLKDCFLISSSSMQQTTQAKVKHIEEPLILGQEAAYARIEELIDYAQPMSRIGVLGMGGSGKTLLLKRLFNSEKVQNLFCIDLLLWLTESRTPSFTTMRNDLARQIAFRINKTVASEEEKDVKIWLSERMKENKFALFLDDVWETNANSLLKEFGVPLPLHMYPPHNSNIIIVSSRNSRALLEIGIPTLLTVQMHELTENDSWQLFMSHAFRHNDGKPPINIDEEIARLVCKECRGLPLAITVTGRAMAGITRSEEWEFTHKRLQNSEPIKYGEVTDSLYGPLRLSYDALADFDISLQLCFLYLAAFGEDQIIYTPHVSMLWIGEGLVAGQDPLQIGQTYVNILADRCLVQAIRKDIDGRVVWFRVHDVLYHLA